VSNTLPKTLSKRRCSRSVGTIGRYSRECYISYTKGGVSLKVFAKAFGISEGTKKATIDGSEVGENYLRYGASLKCNDVNVKLTGDELFVHPDHDLIPRVATVYSL
jgi:D-aminopeptidase